MLFMLMPLQALAERIPVAILRTNADGKTKTLTFTYAEKPKAFAKRGQDGIHKLFEGLSQNPLEILQDGRKLFYAIPTWFNINAKGNKGSNEAITKVVFDKSFAQARPTSTYSWFCGMKNLISIEGMEYLDTSRVKYMQNMFEGCSNLEYIDVSRFNTENVEYMGCMFYGCSNLEYIDVSRFNTENVQYMTGMFCGCSNLEYIDVSRFNTENVRDMTGMFYDCSNLKYIDLSGFFISGACETIQMFLGCTSLKGISIGSLFHDPSAFERRNCMFMGVGKEDSPCQLFVGEWFDRDLLGEEYGEAPNTFYIWHNGYFKCHNEDSDSYVDLVPVDSVIVSDCDSTIIISY